MKKVAVGRIKNWVEGGTLSLVTENHDLALLKIILIFTGWCNIIHEPKKGGREVDRWRLLIQYQLEPVGK